MKAQCAVSSPCPGKQPASQKRRSFSITMHKSVALKGLCKSWQPLWLCRLVQSMVPLHRISGLRITPMPFLHPVCTGWKVWISTTKTFRSDSTVSAFQTASLSCSTGQKKRQEVRKEERPVWFFTKPINLPVVCWRRSGLGKYTLTPMAAPSGTTTVVWISSSDSKEAI